MSSTSRSPDDPPPDSPKAEADKEKKKKPGSPGRYSMSDDGDEVPATRIDSTTRMPAVRVDTTASTQPSQPSQPAQPAQPTQASRAPDPPSSPSPTSTRGLERLPPPTREKKKPPVSLPSRITGGAQPQGATQRAMPAPLARNAAPASAPKLDVATTSAETTEATDENKAKDESVRRPSAAMLVAAAAMTDIPDDAKAKKDEGELPAKEGAIAANAADAALAEPAAEAKKSSLVPKPISVAPPKPLSIVPPAPSRRVSSLRPPPPPKAASIAPPPPSSGNGPLFEFDEGSIAFAFDALVSDERTTSPGKHEFDLAPVRELFAELAANHMRHVRDFMIDVKWGEVTRDWIHICLPPVRTLRRAAERLDLVELGVALERLGSDLDGANAAGGGQMLDAVEKQTLLDSYSALVTILPQAFALERDKTQREAVIVQALLLQVPDVRKVTIDKLHAAGLTSLSVLYDANAHDIAHVTGIQHSLASRIVERVQAYRAELKTSSPQDARAAEREKLATLNQQLKRNHDGYEEAATGWGPDAKAKRRESFRAREETWLEISVLLARFGEVDRLQGIEKVPFVERIAQLTDYLEEAREKYRSEAS